MIMPTDINLQSPMETTVVIPEFNTAVGVMQVTCIYIICVRISKLNAFD